MQLHNWMVKYTPQSAWIENKGVLVWLSLYAGILGGGAYLASLIFNSLWGMFVSWLIIVVIKGGLHIAHAERFSRLWMMVLRPRTSWISRGLIITAALAILGAVQLIFSFWMPGSTMEMIFKVLTGIVALGVILYAGLALSDVTGIPLWNSAMLPLQFIIWGILSGLALVMVINTANTAAGSNILVMSFLILLIAALIILFLFLWAGTFSQPVARESSSRILRGNFAPLFWAGVVVIGLILPIIISVALFMTGKDPDLMLGILVLICELVGGLSLTYSIMRAGYYRTLIGTPD